jgi:hypothetical protein
MQTAIALSNHCGTHVNTYPNPYPRAPRGQPGSRRPGHSRTSKAVIIVLLLLGAVIAVPVIIVAGSCLVGALYYAAMSPEKRAALEAKENAEHAAAAKAALKRLTLIAQSLPAENELKQQPCPADLEQKKIGYLPVDAAFFSQFTADGFAPKQDPTYRKYFSQEKDYEGVWYRAWEFSSIRQALTSEPRDNKLLADSYDDLLAKGLQERGYLAVIYPKKESLPVIHGYPRGKTVTLEPGSFEGWVVLVDVKEARPLCQAAFSAANSDKVSFGAAQDPLAAAFDDFEDTFFRACEAAISTMGPKPRKYDHAP